MISKNVTITLTCDTCKKNSITINEKDFEKSLKAEKWEYKTNRYPTSANTIAECLCPECAKKEYDKKYNSESITDRLSTNYYYDHPKKFNEDVLKELGLTNHPKASKLMKIAYDEGHSAGYSEVYGKALTYSELLID